MNRKYNAYVKLHNNSIVTDGKTLAIHPHNLTRNAFYYDDNSKHFFGTTWLDLATGDSHMLLVTPLKALYVDHDGELVGEV